MTRTLMKLKWSHWVENTVGEHSLLMQHSPALHHHWKVLYSSRISLGLISGLHLQFLAGADCYFSFSLENCTTQTWILLLEYVFHIHLMPFGTHFLFHFTLKTLKGGWWNCSFVLLNWRCSPARIPSGGFRVNSTDTKIVQVIFCNRKNK